MKRRHTTPRYYARNAAMQAQRRFLRTGKTEAERLDDHRGGNGKCAGAVYFGGDLRQIRHW